MGAHPLAFDCATRIPPHSLVWVVRDRDRISIGNITPRPQEIAGLNDEQYARIANAFLEQVVARTSAGSRIRVSVK